MTFKEILEPKELDEGSRAEEKLKNHLSKLFEYSHQYNVIDSKKSTGYSTTLLVEDQDQVFEIDISTINYK